ncbi:hypothetical protein U1Q18_000583, partial [Sarracenia purpurea var. burkii]
PKANRRKGRILILWELGRTIGEGRDQFGVGYPPHRRRYTDDGREGGRGSCEQKGGKRERVGTTLVSAENRGGDPPCRRCFSLPPALPLPSVCVRERKGCFY